MKKKHLLGLLLLLLVVTNCLTILVSHARTETSLTDIDVDGYILENGGGLTRDTASDHIYTGLIIGDPDTYHGYIEWNTSEIPDTAIIDSVRISYQLAVQGVAMPINSMETRPTTATKQQTFDDAENGTEYYADFSNLAIDTWHTITLNGAAADLQAHLADDWFAIGTEDEGAGSRPDIKSSETAFDAILHVSWHLASDYSYEFTDTYYENGTLFVPPVNVTATGPGFIEEFNTSGGTNQYYPVEPERFQWSITDGVSTATRRIYSIGDENITVTYPESTFDTFVFTVRDFTGKLSKGDAYLEAWRIINATDTLIERQKIDIHNEVPLNLVIGATYTIRVRFYDGSLLTWGAFVPGETTTFTIVLRGVAFTDQAYQVSNFIFVEITRTGGTLFTIDYEATKNQTIWANVTIMIRNGAIVSQVSRTNNSFVYNYAGAAANTSYVVLVEGVHSLRRTWGYTRIFDATETYPDVPDMGSIFPMGDMDTTSLIGWVLTIASGLTFSLVYRRAALLAMGTVGSLVTVFGFTDWSYYLLAFVWFFGIIVYLGSGEKG